MHPILMCINLPLIKSAAFSCRTFCCSRSSDHLWLDHWAITLAAIATTPTTTLSSKDRKFWASVPLNVIQEMGAWQSTEMVRRYAHLAPEKFGIHASIVDNMLYDTNTAQAC